MSEDLDPAIIVFGAKSINISSGGYTRIPLYKLGNNLKSLNLSFNPIKNLSSLPRLPNLQILILDGTLIDSLEGVVNQPSLNTLSFLDTPLAARKFSRLMSSIAFGRNLGIINDQSITIIEREKCESYTPLIRKYLFQGYLILQTQPLILYHPETDDQIRIPLKPLPTLFDSHRDSEFDERVVINDIKKHLRSEDIVIVKTVEPNPKDILAYHKLNLRRIDTIESSPPATTASSARSILGLSRALSASSLN